MAIVPAQHPTASLDFFNGKLRDRRDRMLWSSGYSQTVPPGELANMSTIFAHIQQSELAATTNRMIARFAAPSIEGPIVGDGKELEGKGEKPITYHLSFDINRVVFVQQSVSRMEAADTGTQAYASVNDLMERLADRYMKWMDQAKTDMLQGGMKDDPLSHVIDFEDQFGYNELLALEEYLQTGQKPQVRNSSGVARALTFSDPFVDRIPPSPFMVVNNKPYWLLVIDTKTRHKLLQSVPLQNILREGDVRGNGNRLLTGVIGTIGCLMIKEMPYAIGGKIRSNLNWWDQGDIEEVQIPGLRELDVNSEAETTAGRIPKWTGQPGFKAGGAKTSMCLLLGGGCVFYATAASPRYETNSQQFRETWEAAFLTYLEWQRLTLDVTTVDRHRAYAGYHKGITGIKVTHNASA